MAYNFNDWASQYNLTDDQRASVQSVLENPEYIQKTRPYNLYYGDRADELRARDAAIQLGILNQTQSGGQFGDWSTTNTGSGGSTTGSQWGTTGAAPAGMTDTPTGVVNAPTPTSSPAPRDGMTFNDIWRQKYGDSMVDNFYNQTNRGPTGLLNPPVTTTPGQVTAPAGRQAVIQAQLRAQLQNPRR